MSRPMLAFATPWVGQLCVRLAGQPCALHLPALSRPPETFVLVALCLVCFDAQQLLLGTTLHNGMSDSPNLVGPNTSEHCKLFTYT